MSGFGFRIGLSLAFAGQGMIFGLGYNNALSAGEAPPPGSALYWVLHGGLIVSALAVIFLLGRPLLRETALAFRQRRLSVEALFVLSAFGAFAGSLLSSIRGEGSVYYEVVSIVLCVYAIGKQIGALQKGRLGEALSAFRQAFDLAQVETPAGGLERKPVSELLPGDRVRIRPGDPIPVDAVIESGSGFVRETPLTGEPSPVSKGPGDRVMAGTWSLDGNLRLRPVLEETRTIDQILALLQSAPAQPSNLQAAADKLMQVFVPFVSLTAAGTFLGWLFLSANPWWDALFNAMAVLLVACPCALGLAMPTGIWAGLFHLSQRGIVGRHGHLLDTLADCTLVVFDKTGTLSTFDLQVNSDHLHARGEARQQLLERIAAVGVQSQHPVSAALAHLAPARAAVRDLHIFPGQGMAATVDGHRLLIGEASLFRDHSLPAPGDPPGPGKPVHVAENGQFAGTLLLRETLRPEAPATLEALQKMGCRCRILSGDPRPEHPSIGGVEVQGGLSPTEKAHEVRAWAQAGEHILFIGDGINDLPAMQASRSALAIDLGAALATEFADGLLVGGRVSSLPSAIHHARRLKQRLQGNLRFALVYNVFGMGLAAAGILHPVVAAFLMVGSSAIVSVRALRAASQAA